jgi:BON domain
MRDRFRNRADEHAHTGRSRSYGPGWRNDTPGPRERGERWRSMPEQDRDNWDRDWRERSATSSTRGGAPWNRGSFDAERYPDEKYGGPAYSRGREGYWADDRDDRRWRGEGYARERRSTWGGGYRGHPDDDDRRARWEEEGTIGRSGFPSAAERFSPAGPDEEFTNRGDWPNGGFAGKGPKGYKRSDERISEDISDRLTYDPRVDASEIIVQVQNGEVTLSGTVESRDQKRRAEELAESVSGVQEVINQIRITPQSGRDTPGTGFRATSATGTGERARQDPTRDRSSMD